MSQPPPKRRHKSTMVGIGAVQSPVAPPTNAQPPSAQLPPLAPAAPPAAAAPPAVDPGEWDDDDEATQVYSADDHGDLLAAASGGALNTPVAPAPAAAPDATATPVAPALDPSLGDYEATVVDPQIPGPALVPREAPQVPQAAAPAAPAARRPVADVPMPKARREETAQPRPSLHPPAPYEKTEVLQRPPPASEGPVIGPMAMALAIVLLILVVIGGVVAEGWFITDDPGTIQFVTQPADAVVLFDGEPVAASHSPFVISNVEPDEEHLIEVRRSGYRTWAMTVMVPSGQVRELPTVALVPAEGGVAAAAPVQAGFGGFTLNTEPSGATVTLDGTVLGAPTPVRVNDLQAGSHALRVELEGRLPWEGEIEIVGGEVVAVPKVNLSPESVTGSFTSTPAGAMVRLVRGNLSRRLGRTPIDAAIAQGQGPWTVELSVNGYRDWTAPLHIPPGQHEVSVHAVLEALPAGAARRPRRAYSAMRAATPTTAAPATAAPTPTPEPATAEPAVAEPTPEPAVAEPTPEPAPEAQEPGRLKIDTIPSVRVIVDGRSVGSTPLVNPGIELSPGPHRVTLINPEFGIRRTLSVTIRSGQVDERMMELLSQ